MTRKTSTLPPIPAGPPHRLIMDTREPVDLCWLLQSEGFEVDRVALETGDYVWIARGGFDVGVERKTVTDLLGSLRERQANKRSRVVNQLQRLQVCYTESILLLEGEMQPAANGRVRANGRLTNWLWESVDNFLLTAQRGGVAVVRCSKGGVPARLKGLMAYYDKTGHAIAPATKPREIDVRSIPGKEVA